MKKISWKWKDPSHFEAHRSEFSRPVEEILEEIEPLIHESDHKPGTIMHRDFLLKRATGKTGLREINGTEEFSFWAYRKGRSIPSHLILGEKESTNWICLWGSWEEDAFLIHTIYPGKVAPREIHDRNLKLEEIPVAIAFWSRFAIITEEGAYSIEPEN